LSEDTRHGAAYSLWDVYPFADFITYPSLYEGFGNAFLEAIYFRKPILVNRYATFVRDIEPLGFDLVIMDGYLTRDTVAAVRALLESPARREEMANHNYRVASRHYSYRLLICRLNAILTDIFGPEARDMLTGAGDCNGFIEVPDAAPPAAAAAMR
jgi:glycosyltransferase involved in cell wall biosynthesis